MKEMKRSNNTIFKYTMILGAAMSLSACNGLFENIYDAPTETEMEIKENSFSQIKTVEYTEWAYIDFSGRKVTTVKIGKEYESEIPDNWDIAIHRYDIKTNEGAAYQTSYLIRLKDNTYAAIRFTNYTNAKGIKGYIDFDFLYPFDFEKNN